MYIVQLNCCFPRKPSNGAQIELWVFSARDTSFLKFGFSPYSSKGLGFPHRCISWSIIYNAWCQEISPAPIEVDVGLAPESVWTFWPTVKSPLTVQNLVQLFYSFVLNPLSQLLTEYNVS